MRLNKILFAALVASAVPAAVAGVYPQCPFPVPSTAPAFPAAPAAGVIYKETDATGLTFYSRMVDAKGRVPGDAGYAPPTAAAPHHRQVCLHIVGGDGWMVLGNGAQTYGFGFAPAKGTGDDVMVNGLSDARFPAPTFTFRETDEVWAALTNVGMIHRPDLFDQHSIHFHGYPQASAIFDGVPNASVTVEMGSTFTYYYKVNDPGTYMWHCHVEATEHMEMGMLGMLNVLPRQSFTPSGGRRTDTSLGGYTQFAFNDGDGSTGYHKMFSLQMGGIDSNFHELHELVQPLPFLELKADFAQLNGRGYPMTTFEGAAATGVGATKVDMGKPDNSPEVSQNLHAVIRAKQGEKVLLRVSSLSVDSYYTLTALGLPMRMVGRGAHIARGPADVSNLVSAAAGAASWAYDTSAVTLGGGEAADMLVDTSGVAPGTYYIYSTNLNFLSNGAKEDRGGLMTTFIVTAN
jgi:FtsP/CotA-like multicopper oxidase with cupredoxin domain